MIIERFRGSDGRILNKAADKKDYYLFLHCSNGSESVTTRCLNENVIPMLYLHGVGMIEIVDGKSL